MGPSADATVVEPAVDAGKAVTILYTNYRGERGKRFIVPRSIWFGCTEWHPENQWLLEAYDLDKQALRSFALQDLEMWAQEPAPSPSLASLRCSAFGEAALFAVAADSHQRPGLPANESASAPVR